MAGKKKSRARSQRRPRAAGTKSSGNGKTPATLRDPREQYRMLVEGIKDYAIYLLDTDGGITNWNLGAERIKGYTASEIIGKNFSLFYGKQDQRDGVPAKALKTAATQGKTRPKAGASARTAAVSGQAF
jgi:PAS domain-containing protein